ncbi:uncharacterized protein SCHCODRAFT_02555528 [Schizophyllum commune H4-8]|uniref:uncharacterized protein n=1 Tax=Schizophyllum commune (strain H4-8 / FGSC 9210) TaxID=578458 RepID=UPI00215E5728|nr:uncharacterized protein SCHCODRAFT_02555528 [Schizophyllum commune H4-8]KAI5886507.1 hypothetical protein SCHCODRAFT_02555528 [Schizophyllum commune H4-8]
MSSPLPSWNAMREPTSSSVADEEETTGESNANDTPASTLVPTSRVDRPRQQPPTRLQPRDPNRSAAVTRPTHRASQPTRISSDEEDEITTPLPKRKGRERPPKERGRKSVSAHGGGSASAPSETFQDLFGGPALAQNASGAVSSRATQTPASGATQPAPTSSCAPSTSTSVSSRTQPLKESVGWSSGRSQTVLNDSSQGPVKSATLMSKAPATAPDLKTTDSSRKPLSRPPPTPSKRQVQQEVIDLVSSEDDASVPTPGTSTNSAATGSAPRKSARDILPSVSQSAPTTRPSSSLSGRQGRSSSRRHLTQLQPPSTSQLDPTQPPFAPLPAASSAQPLAQAPIAPQPSQRGRHRQIIDIDDAGRGVSRKKEPPPSDREVISISDDDEKKDEEIVIIGTRNAPFKGAKQPTRDRDVKGKGRAKLSSTSDPRKPTPRSSSAKYRRTTRSSKYEPDSDIEIIDPPPPTSASGKVGAKGRETERQHKEKSVERSANDRGPVTRDGRTSSPSQPPEHLFLSAPYEDDPPFLPEADIEELPPLPEDDDDEPMAIDAPMPIDNKPEEVEDSMSVDELEPLPVQSGIETTTDQRPDTVVVEDDFMSVDPAIPRDDAYVRIETNPAPASESTPCNDVCNQTHQSAPLDIDQPPQHDEVDQLVGHTLSSPLSSRPLPDSSSARHAASVNRPQSASATSSSATSNVAVEAKTLSAVTPCGARNAMVSRRSAAVFCNAQLSTKANASRNDTSPSTSGAGPSCSGRSPSSGTVLSTGDTQPSASSGSGSSALSHSTPVFESYDDDELYADSDKEEVIRTVSDGGKGKGRADQHKLDRGKLDGEKRAPDTDELATRTTALSISPSASHTTSTPADGSTVRIRRLSIAKDSAAVAPVFTSVWPAKSAVAPAHSFPMRGAWMSTTWMQPQQQQQPTAITAMKPSNNAAESSGMTMATSSTLAAATPSAPGSVTLPFATDTSPFQSTNDSVELVEEPSFPRKRSRVPSASPSRPAPAERTGAAENCINEPPVRSSPPVSRSQPTVPPMTSRVATPSKFPVLHIDLRTFRQNNLGSTPLKILSTPSKVATREAEETDIDGATQRVPTHGISLLHDRMDSSSPVHRPSPPPVEDCQSILSTSPSAEQHQGPQETVNAQEDQSLTTASPLAGPSVPIAQLAGIAQCAPTAANDSDEESFLIPYYGKRKRASTSSNSTPAPAEKSDEDAGRRAESKGEARAVGADNHTVSGDKGEYSEDDGNAESSDNQSSIPESEIRPAYPRYSKPVARKSAGGRLPRLRLPPTTIDASPQDTNSDLCPSSSSAPRAAPPLPSRWNRVRPVARKSTGGKPLGSSSDNAFSLSSDAHPPTIRYPSSVTNSDIGPRYQGDLVGAINNKSTPSPKPPPHKRRRLEAKQAATGHGPLFQHRAAVPETISLVSSDEEVSTSNSPPRVHNSDDGDAESVANMLESTPPTTDTAPDPTASGGNGVMQTARKIVGAAYNAFKEPYNAVKEQVLGVVHNGQRSSEGESSRSPSSEPSTQSVDERARRNRSNPVPFASASSESDFQDSAGDDSEGPSTQRRNLRRRRKAVNYAEVPPSVDQDSDGTQSVRVRSPERSDDSVSHKPPPLPSRMRRAHIMTWTKRVQELRKEPPPYFKSKNIPHRLEDSVNYMSLRERNQTHAMGPVYWALAFSHASVFNDDGVRFMMEECIKDADREERLPGSAGPLPPPMRIINEIDGDATPPWEFHYSNVMWHGKHVPKPNRKDRVGCGCIGDCSSNRHCACLKEQRRWTETWGLKGFAYDKDKRLIVFEQLPVFECNELCGCDDNCRNRVVQHGRRMPLVIKKTKHKGWGVFNGAKKIRSGEFIGIYAGELLDERESHRRGLKYNRFGRTYLLDLDFWWCRRNDRTQAPQPKPGPHAKEESPAGKAKKKGRTRKQSSQDPDEQPEEELVVEEDDAPGWEPLYTVDAYHAGNFTRFFNHSCDPNLITTGVYVSEANVDKPLVCFFACRDIAPEEELTFNYRGADDEGPQDGPATVHSDEVYAKCLCGAANCTGTMFNSR